MRKACISCCFVLDIQNRCNKEIPSVKTFCSLGSFHGQWREIVNWVQRIGHEGAICVIMAIVAVTLEP